MTENDFEEHLDELTTRLLLPLRSDKHVDEKAMDELCLLVERVRSEGTFSNTIEISLVGKLWFVFCQMLTEAEYAPQPQAIGRAAWRYQDELTKLFGPHFGAHGHPNPS